jgi:hypothetical protein
MNPVSQNVAGPNSKCEPLDVAQAKEVLYYFSAVFFFSLSMPVQRNVAGEKPR